MCRIPSTLTHTIPATHVKNGRTSQITSATTRQKDDSFRQRKKRCLTPMRMPIVIVQHPTCRKSNQESRWTIPTISIPYVSVISESFASGRQNFIAMVETVASLNPIYCLACLFLGEPSLVQSLRWNDRFYPSRRGGW